MGDIHEEARALLRDEFEVKVVSNEAFSQGGAGNFDVVVIRTHTKIGREELERLERLKYLVSCSVGIDNIDLDALKERGVELVHAPGSNANSVAEHVLYMVLGLIRGNGDRPFFELKGKKVGIIGFGEVGKEVARKLTGFGVELMAFDVIPQDPSVLEELGVKMKSLEEVVEESDLISVHVPLNEHTKGMIDSGLFSKMKPGSFFINSSRAEVVDEAALLESFDAGKFRGLGLDVYSEDLKRGLLEREGNVMLSDHVAAYGENSLRDMCVKPVKKLLEYINS